MFVFLFFQKQSLLSRSVSLSLSLSLSPTLPLPPRPFISPFSTCSLFLIGGDFPTVLNNTFSEIKQYRSAYYAAVSWADFVAGVLIVPNSPTCFWDVLFFLDEISVKRNQL